MKSTRKASKPRKAQAPRATRALKLPIIDIAIPTLHRPEKLTTCVTSILDGTYKNVRVHILWTDFNEMPRYARQFKHDPRVFVQQTDYSKVSTCWNNFVKQSTADLILFLCDDCALDKDCLMNAVKAMQGKFPDGDGVIGLNVTNYPPSWPEAITQYGFRLVGKKFHKRFPEGQAYCPEYYRFYVDTEMGEYAKNHVHRFLFCKGATMQHFHPNAPGGTLDDTHYENRGERQKWDIEIWGARQAKGYLWGKDFNIVGIR